MDTNTLVKVAELLKKAEQEATAEKRIKCAQYVVGLTAVIALNNKLKGN
jgi:hypothetical protein